MITSRRRTVWRAPEGIRQAVNPKLVARAHGGIPRGAIRRGCFGQLALGRGCGATCSRSMFRPGRHAEPLDANSVAGAAPFVSGGKAESHILGRSCTIANGQTATSVSVRPVMICARLLPRAVRQPHPTLRTGGLVARRVGRLDAFRGLRLDRMLESGFLERRWFRIARPGIGSR